MAHWTRDEQSGAHPPGSAHECVVAFEEAKLTFDLSGNANSNAYADGSRGPARCAQPQRARGAKVDSVEAPVEVHRHRQAAGAAGEVEHALRSAMPLHRPQTFQRLERAQQ